ncbi:hypothetical protein BZG02_16740 [Labilibaculum filiforme]|uniref:Uncharacterized protein n=1 Tax=Labilibaculum filiforme TaxID=1940526 RepID=A0A2N3HSQ9_9BACT|nr:hypothetical protein BZG02_16740 [Labilibaculum filiforme]
MGKRKLKKITFSGIYSPLSTLQRCSRTIAKSVTNVTNTKINQIFLSFYLLPDFGQKKSQSNFDWDLYILEQV